MTEERTKKNTTDRAWVLSVMQKKGYITATEAWLHGCRRLGARIWELRHEAGYQIRTDERPNGECYYWLEAAPLV